MIKTVVLIPVSDNDGNLFSNKDWQELEARFIAVLGGYSRHVDVPGAWRDDEGRLYDDVSRQYVVYLASFRQLPAWLGIVDWAREHFRQEAIATEINGYPEIFGSG
ncbi:MAG: hypothetical protein HY689_00260 [Chloroflexi bacterium]|nr:hypothetical protein [Chloroflexota bacterium]